MTSADVPTTRAQSSAGLTAPVAGVVADDLQAIFPNAPPRPAGARAMLGVSRAARRSPRPSSRIAAIGALAAAALAGLSAGALIGRHPAPASPAPPRADGVPIVLASQPEARQTPIEVAPSLPSRPGSPRGLPEPGPLAPPQLVWTASGARSAAAVVKVKEEASAKPRSQKVARRRASSFSSFAPTYRAAAASTSRCRADCDYEDVLTADARLRRAYASAADAGVARPVLVSYRNEWSGLRKRAPSSPDRVVSRYNEMADSLERYAERPRPHRSSGPRSHTLAGLRADLASLFP
jgi:hypothetical protein